MDKTTRAFVNNAHDDVRAALAVLRVAIASNTKPTQAEISEMQMKLVNADKFLKMAKG